MHAERCPYRARAWWGDRLVAESTSALRVEEPGRTPVLCFPNEDVRFDLFCEEGGEGVWSIDGDGGPPPESWFDEPVTGPVDGTGVLRRLREPLPLAGLAAFDHDRVRVELVDERPGDASRDVTVKRFPTWGDASHLIDMLDVRPDGDRRYASVTGNDPRRPVVEGSQLLAQAIVAAGRHAPGRRAVSAHMIFLRAADGGQPLELDLEELSAGRTFTALSVDVGQGGRRCARGAVLLDVTAPDTVRHAAPPPPVAGPYDSQAYDMSVTGRDVRIVDGAYTDDPEAPVGPPVLDAWVRFRTVPEDPYLHAGLLVQFTGHLSIAAALRPHTGIGQRQAHRTLSTAINAIGLSLHADVRADRWMRYHHRSTFAGDGMTHAVCSVTDEAGALLASFSVDAMVRPFEGTAGTRTAL
ncbi:MAG: acyl-CoA thioesterase domain-containing protein [Acidimicrobiales bacterium]